MAFVKADGKKERKELEKLIATELEAIKADKQEEIARLMLYTLIGEGYQAMLDGRESTLEDVKQRIAGRRKKRD